MECDFDENGKEIDKFIEIGGKAIHCTYGENDEANRHGFGIYLNCF